MVILLLLLALSAFINFLLLAFFFLIIVLVTVDISWITLFDEIIFREGVLGIGCDDDLRDCDAFLRFYARSRMNWYFSDFIYHYYCLSTIKLSSSYSTSFASSRS